MITNGFAFGISDAVTLDTNFPMPSAYIYVGTAAGDIVYVNTAGDNQVLLNAGLGYHPIAARRILTNGTVNGTPRVTSATGLCYCSTNIP